MSINISKLTIAQLNELIGECTARIDELKVQLRDETRSKAMSLIADAGFTLDEILGKDGRRRGFKRTPSVIKYRNPKNPKQEWTGKGRPPQWLVDAVAAGKKREDFAV
jgi:DNA-binding protein H-NS